MLYYTSVIPLALKSDMKYMTFSFAKEYYKETSSLYFVIQTRFKQNQSFVFIFTENEQW